MVIYASASQNLSVGVTFGVFGVLLLQVSEAFDAPIANTALSISFVLLFGGLGAPLIGRYLDRYSVRRLMQVGALMQCIGFYGAGISQTLLQFQLYYGVIIGAGTMMMGVVPASSLVNNWFVDQRGKALGFTNFPLGIVIVPLTATWLIALLGWRDTLHVIAAMYLLVIPLLQGIVDRPQDIQQVPLGQESIDSEVLDTELTVPAPVNQKPEAQMNSASKKASLGKVPSSTITMKELLLSRDYWFLFIAVGLAISTGVVISSHIVNHATAIGLSAEHGALLVTANGFSGVIGAIGFGMIADKIGAQKALVIGISIQASMWFALLFVNQFSILIPVTLAIGLGSGGIFPVFSAFLSSRYGANNLGTVLGLTTLLMLPFTVTSSPLAGLLFDIYGHYSVTFAIHVCGLLLAACLLLMIRSKRSPAS